MKVHIVGAGSVGTFVGAGLAQGHATTQVRVILRSSERALRFQQQGSALRLRTRQLGPEMVLEQRVVALSPQQAAASGPIEHLVVTTKCQDTVGALRPLQQALTRNSTVLLLQNGLGVYDQLVRQLFADDDSRPQFVLGVLSHGLKPVVSSQFFADHMGTGYMKLAPVPRRLDHQLSFELAKTVKPSLELADALVSTPLFNAELLSYPELVLAQFEKAIVNACINPTAAVLNCRNGLLLEAGIEPVFKNVIRECSQALRELGSTIFEPNALPTLHTALDPDRLLRVVKQTCEATAENRCSMLTDVTAGRETELPFISEYFVGLAQSQGRLALTNSTLAQLVRSRTSVVRSEDEDMVQFVS